MPRNPFMKKSEWKEVKEKYFIPDKVVKSGSFGEQMQKIYDKFEKEGLTNLTKPKVPVAMDLIKQARKLFDDWLEGAAKLQADKFNNKEKKDGQKNKDGAIVRVKYFRGLLQDLENNAESTKDYFAGPRSNYDKCFAQMKAALANPTDAKALQELYSQGIRNHLGGSVPRGVGRVQGAQGSHGRAPEVREIVGQMEPPARLGHSGTRERSRKAGGVSEGYE